MMQKYPIGQAGFCGELLIDSYTLVLLAIEVWLSIWILLNLKYKKTEDNRLNIYIESNDPVISILSTSDFSRLEFKNEVIKEFPQDAIDAVEV